MTKIGAAAFAAILVLAVAGTASAAEPIRAINTKGVDWRDDAQVAQIHHQISQAARSLCRAHLVPGPGQARIMRRCMLDTVRETLQESGRPELVRLAQASNQ